MRKRSSSRGAPPRHASKEAAGGPAATTPRDRTRRKTSSDAAAEADGSPIVGIGASDGTAGLRAIKGAGGVTFAQDEKSAKFDGMPRSAIAAGCVDFTLRPSEIAWELARIGSHPYVYAATRAERVLVATPEELNKVFILLRAATGTDFTYYKDTTIRRRIARRMVLHKVDKMEHYLRFLEAHPQELKALFQDILINVTSFFREPATF